MFPKAGNASFCTIFGSVIFLSVILGEVDVTYGQFGMLGSNWGLGGGKIEI